jgi:hypothetical protein
MFKKHECLYKCEFCTKTVDTRLLDSTGPLKCEGCSSILCENCAVYGFDGLARCPKCHSEHIDDCNKTCRGNIDDSPCSWCDWAD